MGREWATEDQEAKRRGGQQDEGEDEDEDEDEDGGRNWERNRAEVGKDVSSSKVSSSKVSSRNGNSRNWGSGGL